MDKVSERKRVTVSGVVLTVLVTAGFVLSAVMWYDLYKEPPKPTVADMKANELIAFDNLQAIIKAQKQYKLSDFDADGKKTYASFLVHLWTCIDAKNDPILIDLIPRKLAFAMAPARALNGYYFPDLHTRALAEPDQEMQLDYENQWAIAAAPATIAETGCLVFITDHTGSIYAKNSTTAPLAYPHDPAANGWTKIDSPEQLVNLQKSVQYSKK